MWIAQASMSHLVLKLPLRHRRERPGWWRTRAWWVFDRARHCEVRSSGLNCSRRRVTGRCRDDKVEDDQVSRESSECGKERGPGESRKW